MECSDCKGEGFKEYDAGLLVIGCISCSGIGKVDEALTEEEFLKAYAFRSDMTPDLVAEFGLIAVPADCVEGWAMEKADQGQPIDRVEIVAEFTSHNTYELPRELKPNEYQCSKCSKPGKPIIHRKSGKGIGHKHQEFKVTA